MAPRNSKKEVSKRGSTSQGEGATQKRAKATLVEPVENPDFDPNTGERIREPKIRFKHGSDQKERYDYLSKRGFIGTKYLCEDTLTKLGLKDDVFTFLSGTELLEFCNTPRDTFKRLTLEVLSSCNILMNPEYDTNPEEDKWLFVFRLYNIDYSYTMTEFGELMMLPSEGEEEAPGDYNHAIFWDEISMRGVLGDGTERPLKAGEKIYDPKLAKISKIYNPVFKYTAKVLANSIFCRGLDAGGFPRSDNYFLYCMWNNIGINAAYHFAKSLVRQGKTDRGLIPNGGFITRLVERMQVSFMNDKIEKKYVMLDLKNCIDAKWLKVKNDQFWYVFHDIEVLQFPYDPSLGFTEDKTNWKPTRQMLMKTPLAGASSSTMQHNEPFEDFAQQMHNESQGNPYIPSWTPSTNARPSHASVEDRNYNMMLELQRENQELRSKVEKAEESKNSLKKYMKKSFKKLFSGLNISPPSSSEEEERQG